MAEVLVLFGGPTCRNVDGRFITGRNAVRELQLKKGGYGQLLLIKVRTDVID